MSLWWITRLKQVSSICRLICIAHWNECFLFLVTGTMSERITPTRGLNAARDVYHMRFCLCFSTTEHSACYFALISNIGARTRWHCCHILLYTQKHTHAQIDRDWQTQCNWRLKRRKDVFCCSLSLSLFDTHTYIFFFLWLFSPSFFHTLITSVYSSSVMCRYYKNRHPIRHKATVTVAYSRHALLCSPWNCDMV